jgi:excisionase family DNA binding protein
MPIPNNPITRQAYSPDEVAEMYGIGRTTIFAEIRAGKIEARKVGARTLISAAEAERWFASLSTRTAA